MYVAASPHLRATRQVLGAVLKATRLLATAASRGHGRGGGRGEQEAGLDDTHDHYWEVIQRLARPNQQEFRRGLLREFGWCVISGETDALVLDAAHIEPFGDEGTDRPENGLLLRADLHRLFDAGRLTITPSEQGMVLVGEGLAKGDYGALHGAPILPDLGPRRRHQLAARYEKWTPSGIRE